MNIIYKILTSTAILGLFNTAMPAQTLVPVVTASVAAGEIQVPSQSQIVEAFLGNMPESEKQAIVDKQTEYVSTREAYPASLAVVEKHAEAIKATAQEKGVPEDVALGVALLENGGSETAVSSAGAMGIYQLMPGTAKSLGLTVSKSVDERKNPAKSIEAGVRYLSMNFERFGDWGLATWAYHAGEGNVSKAVKIYARENHGVALAGVKDPGAMRDYVESHGVTVHKLLSDPAVKKFTKELNDDSAGYPYKVIATATLFREANR